MPIPFVQFELRGIKFTAYEIVGEYKILLMPGNKILTPARLGSLLQESIRK